MSISSPSPLAALKGARVLLISHDFTLTGSPLLLVELARALRQAGARVTVASLKDDAQGSLIPQLSDEHVVSIGDSFALAATSDLIVANTAVTGPWIRDLQSRDPLASRRVVWWIHEIDVEYFRAHVAGFQEAAAVLFDSDAALGAWRSTGLAFPSVAAVVNPGVRASLRESGASTRFPDPASRLTRFGWTPMRSRAEIRRRLGVGENDWLIGLFGSYQTAKGHDLFADTVGGVVRETPDLRLKPLIIGFSSVPQVRRFVERHDRQRGVFDLRRTLPLQPDLASYYAACDVFVVNSQGVGETFGRVTTEAMSFGLPVCATAAGGTPEIVIDGQTGLLHRPGVEGQRELARNLRQLADDRVLARRLGEAGRERVNARFTDVQMHRAFAEALRRAGIGH